MKIIVLGAGRAGTSFAAALRAVGHDVALRHHDESTIEPDVDAVLLCVPDDAIIATAESLHVGTSTVVLHCAGSRTLDVLASQENIGSLHPLVALPNAEIGAARLIGATYCVSGDPLASEIVTSLQGRSFDLPDENRAAYHATACVAANHLVTLLGQVQHLAHNAGLELGDFLPLAQSALDDVAAYGPEGALTGPASRGDVVTIDAHLAAIPEDERATYVALANAAFSLAERRNAARPL